MAESKVNNTGCLIGVAGVAGFVLGILSVFVMGFLFILMIAASVGGSGSAESPHGDHIAQIDIEGVITGDSQVSWAGSSESMVERITDQLKRAKDDPRAKAVVVRINSPGGEVTAADTIYHKVKQLAEKKPVIIYMDSMAASGGYYIACAGKEIYANQTTLTGSIGVIMSGLNYEQLFDKVGLRSMTFTSGKFKDVMSGSRTMTEEEQALIHGLVMDIYERFLTVVKEGRTQIPEAELRSNIADGRIFTGSDALDKKLVDALGYIEDAQDRARELGKAPKAEIINYGEEMGLFDALGLTQAAAQAASGKTTVELKLPDGMAPNLKPGMLYLLPASYAN